MWTTIIISIYCVLAWIGGLISAFKYVIRDKGEFSVLDLICLIFFPIILTGAIIIAPFYTSRGQEFLHYNIIKNRRKPIEYGVGMRYNNRAEDDYNYGDGIVIEEDEEIFEIDIETDNKTLNF